MQPCPVAATHELPRRYSPEQRLYDDTTTWLAEVLDGNMRTGFEYNFHGNELYGQDNGPLKPVFKNSLRDAQALAETNPNLAFELRRRWTEMAEYQDMLHMSKGELPNTMIVVSDFPPELLEATSDVGGYNVTRKQTMLRVIIKSPDGLIKMFSQTLDHSDRTALEAIYDFFDETPEPGELLGQRINIDLSADDQDCLIDRLVGIYDRTLTDRYGGSWYAGRSPAETLNTYEFVKRQNDLIKTYMTIPPEHRSNDVKYAVAAAMKYRFDKRADQFAPEQVSVVGPAEINYAFIEMQRAGLRAKSERQVFSGCGSSLEPDTELSTPEQLEKLAYGNKASLETKYKFDKFMHCVACQPEPKKGESKKMCGPCGICRDCDKKMQGKSSR